MPARSRRMPPCHAGPPRQAETLLKQRLATLGPPGEKQMQQLLRRSGQAPSSPREQATEKLTRLGRQGEEALRKALEGKISAEVRRRVQEILKKIENGDTQEAPVVPALAAGRAVECLERLDTAEGRTILQEWSAKAAGKPTGARGEGRPGAAGKRDGQAGDLQADEAGGETLREARAALDDE